MLTNMQNSGNYVRLDNSFDAKTTPTATRTTTEAAAAAAIVADVVVGGSDTDYSMFVAHDNNKIIDNNNYNSHNSHNNKNQNTNNNTNRNSNQTNYSYNNSNNINQNTNNNNTHHLVHHVSDQTTETSVGPLFQRNNNNNNNNNNNHRSDEKTVKDGYKNSTQNNKNKQNFLVDAEQTMEVPLLNCNNNNSDDDDDNHYNNEDYDMQQRHHHHQGDEDHLQHFCLCHQRGFGANLMDKSTQEAKLKIILAISLCVVFMIIEFLGGYLAGSLAIVTDAAHLASDCISFMVGLIAIWLGSRPPDARMSFGYKRTEVMGALISIWSIWILTAALVLAALQRLYSNDYDLDAKTMMIISAIGIVINIVMARILHGSSLLPVGGAHGHGHAHSHTHSHTHSELHTHADTQLMVDASSDASGSEALFTNESCEKNLNLRAAMIHVIGDLVQSVGIFLAAVFIHYFPSAKFMDPLCTILFSVIVLLTTVGLFRESIRILADAVPLELSIEKLETDLSNIEGVKSVHHLNVWKHTTNHNVMMVHLIIDFLSDNNTVLNEATKLASNHEYNIKHSTIQIERLTA